MSKQFKTKAIVDLNTNPTAQPKFDLDQLYDARGIAPWMKLSARVILELARRKKIPAVRINQRIVRFHPRSILAAKGDIS